jgi:pimeloyl-ACP methyl ester carboxylesterase
VAAVGAPIVGDSLSWLLKLTDRPLFADAFARVPAFRRFMFHWFLGEADDQHVHEILDDSVKSSSTTLRNAVGSMWRTDLRPELPRLSVPTLIVHGGRDEIVHPNQADLFNDILLRFLKQDAPRTMPRVQVRQRSIVS